MKRLFVAIALLSLAGSAFAGFSLGFKPLDLPVMVYSGGYDADGLNMIRVGWSASSDFRIELLGGYGKVSWEADSAGTTALDGSGSCFAMGASVFYVIANPANTVCSIGASFVYNKASTETNNVDGWATSGYSFYPLIRVDFAIPGAERFALFTEFGGRYMSATSELDTMKYKATDFSTWGSEHILGGAYYSF